MVGGGRVVPGGVFTVGVVIKLGIVPVVGVETGVVEPVVTNVPFDVTAVGPVGLDTSQAVPMRVARISALIRVM